VYLRMDSKDCSRSQGQPPGARKRAMMATDRSNNAAARAGSVVVCGVESFARELSAGRSIQFQFSLPT